MCGSPGFTPFSVGDKSVEKFEAHGGEIIERKDRKLASNDG
jgi:hypothetical protein